MCTSSHSVNVKVPLKVSAETRVSPRTTGTRWAAVSAPCLRKSPSASIVVSSAVGGNVPPRSGSNGPGNPKPEWFKQIVFHPLAAIDPSLFSGLGSTNKILQRMQATGRDNPNRVYGSIGCRHFRKHVDYTGMQLQVKAIAG